MSKSFEDMFKMPEYQEDKPLVRDMNWDFKTKLGHYFRKKGNEWFYMRPNIFSQLDKYENILLNKQSNESIFKMTYLFLTEAIDYIEVNPKSKITKDEILADFNLAHTVLYCTDPEKARLN